MPVLDPTLTSLLAAVSGFLAAQVWPWLRRRLDHDAQRRQEQAEADRAAERTQRIAQADAWKSIAQSVDLFARTLTAQEFQLNELSRQQARLLDLLAANAPTVFGRRRGDDSSRISAPSKKEDTHGAN